jgi:hypothetical protein
LFNTFLKSLKEKFNAHMHLKKNVDFVKNVVELFELLVEYRDLRIESSDELKTFYLNEILVCFEIFFYFKQTIILKFCFNSSYSTIIWNDMTFMSNMLKYLDKYTLTQRI